MKRTLQILAVIGLTGLMSAGHSEARAAQPTARAKKATPATASAKTAKRPSIAHDPYLGAIVMDAVSGKVLFEDQADAKGFPASVLKLMDLLIILEQVKQGRISLKDQIPVSATASKIGGSQVWLAEKESFTLDDMLYALVVQSANDAAVALAEKIAGSANGFVELMNQRAKQLGMNSTTFHSVHGLPPGVGQQHDVTTARDLALLCRELLKHKDTLRYTSTRERPFRPDEGKKMVLMRTHNHLLGQVEGCDGFKTGYIAQAGYSIAVTAARKNHRVIAIVLGSVDRKVRDAKAAELLSKGFLALPGGSGTPAPSQPPVAPRK